MRTEAEWARALSSLRSASLLLDAGEYNDSVSRSYHASFHAARCLLLTLGLEPASHRGVSHLVNLHFINTGLLERRLGRLLSRMQKFREEADYNRFFIFDREGASEELDASERFVQVTEELLRRGCWIGDDTQE